MLQEGPFTSRARLRMANRLKVPTQEELGILVGIINVVYLLVDAQVLVLQTGILRET